MRLQIESSQRQLLLQKIDLPTGAAFGNVLVASEKELEHFLTEVGAHEVLKPPKGRKTWTALLFAMHKKARGEGRPLDRMADSKIGGVDITIAQEPVAIRKVGDAFEVSNYGAGFERAAQKVLAENLTPQQRKVIETLCRFIRSGLDQKRRILNYALNHQTKFLKTGNLLDIRPIIQKEVADGTKTDISSVSRVLSSVKLYYGRRAINSLHLVPGNRFGMVVLTELVNRIRKKEKRPLTDAEIQRILTERYQSHLEGIGGKIARRTVGKYRNRKSKREK